LTILIVSKATKSPQKDLSIDASHVSRITNISKTTTIDTLVLGSAKAFFIILRISLE